jgi:hypothetical protein
VNVTWTTETEINVNRFEIEKSYDGILFKFTGSVTAIGGQLVTSYKFRDVDIAGSKIYYRLKTVDNDGNFRYSKVTLVTVPVIRHATISPNPFISEIVVQLDLSKNEQLQASLYALSGRLIHEKLIEGKMGLNTIKFTQLDRLPAGMYLVKIFNTGMLMQQKIIKID